MLNLSDKRQPNSMENITSFLQRWHSEGNVQSVPQLYNRSPAGRLNYQGANDCAYAFPYTRSDSYFKDSIEPVVSPLVTKMVSDGLVTYTSCEGHVLGESYLELHVGVIGFATEKVESIVQAVNLTNQILAGQNMQVAFRVYTGELHCETTGGAAACVDVYLERRGEYTVAQYMSVREYAVNQLVCLL